MILGVRNGCLFSAVAVILLSPFTLRINASEPGTPELSHYEIIVELGAKYRDRAGTSREHRQAIDDAFDRLAVSVDLQLEGLPSLGYFSNNREQLGFTGSLRSNPLKSELEAAQERVEMLDLVPETALMEPESASKFGLGADQISEISDVTSTFVLSVSSMVESLAEMPLEQLAKKDADLRAMVAQFIELDMERSKKIREALNPEQLALLDLNDAANDAKREKFLDFSSKLNEGLWMFFQDEEDWDTVEGFIDEARDLVMVERVKLRLRLNEEMKQELPSSAQESLSLIVGPSVEAEILAPLVEYGFFQCDAHAVVLCLLKVANADLALEIMPHQKKAMTRSEKEYRDSLSEYEKSLARQKEFPDPRDKREFLTYGEMREKLLGDLQSQLDEVLDEEQEKRIEQLKLQNIAIAGGLFSLLTHDEVKDKLALSPGQISELRKLAIKHDIEFNKGTWELQQRVLVKIMNEKAPHLVKKFRSELGKIQAEMTALSR